MPQLQFQTKLVPEGCVQCQLISTGSSWLGQWLACSVSYHFQAWTLEKNLQHGLQAFEMCQGVPTAQLLLTHGPIGKDWLRGDPDPPGCPKAPWSCFLLHACIFKAGLGGAVCHVWHPLNNLLSASLPERPKVNQHPQEINEVRRRSSSSQPASGHKSL